jgi:hypothetical protein
MSKKRRKGVQILEETLLIIMAFIGLAVAMGAINKITTQLDAIFNQLWEGLDWLLKTLFYWLPE